MSIHENVGGADRAVRLGLGAVLPLVALFAPIGRGWRIVAGALGGIALVTGATRYCPLNQALGIDTRQRSLTRPPRLAS